MPADPTAPVPAPDTEAVALRCSWCGHWEKGRRTKAQIAEWLRVHKTAMLGIYDGVAGELVSTCPYPCGTPRTQAAPPVPRPDTPTWTTTDPARWTVDDDARKPTLVLDAESNDPLRFTREHMGEVTDTEFAALVALVRAHEACAHHEPVAWTSEDGIHNMARHRVESRSHYTLALRVDRRDDYNTVPLYMHEACTHTTDLPDAETVYQWVMSHDHESIAYPTRHTYMAIIEATLAALLDLLVDGSGDG